MAVRRKRLPGPTSAEQEAQRAEQERAEQEVAAAARKAEQEAAEAILRQQNQQRAAAAARLAAGAGRTYAMSQQGRMAMFGSPEPQEQGQQQEDQFGAELVSRQLTQSVWRSYGGAPRADELGLGPEGELAFTAANERTRDTLAAMQADGLGSGEILTLGRQHEYDLGMAATDHRVQGQVVEAAQLQFMASTHRRELNTWERSQIEAGELSANPALPSEQSDLLDQSLEMDALREGFTLASGLQMADPAQVSFVGVDPVAVPDLPATQQQLGDGLGPKARARLAAHPELAQLVNEDSSAGAGDPVSKIEARTAHLRVVGDEAPEQYPGSRRSRL